MTPILVYGCDDAYFLPTIISLKSFVMHNPNWDIVVMDVGMTPAQVTELKQLARVLPFPREPRQDVLFIPSAKARIMALTLFPNDSTVMLYLDSDSLVFGSFEPLLEQFIASGLPVGIALESDKRFNRLPMNRAWLQDTVPAQLFPRHETWQHRMIPNTGLVLATGNEARAWGQRALPILEEHRNLSLMGEQTILDSVLYEDGIPFLPLPVYQHCYVSEEFVKHRGRGLPYVDTIPYIDSQPVLFRHFCGKLNKQTLAARVPYLCKKFGIRAGTFKPRR